MRMSRRGKIASGAVALVLVVGAAAFSPLVRARVHSEATRRGLSVTVGAVRPGWFSVRLLDVEVAPEGVAGVRASLDEVDVGLSGALAVRAVSVPSGRVDLQGTPEALEEALAGWRGRHPAAASGHEGASSSRTAKVRGLTVRWEKLAGEGGDASLEADGVVLDRGPDGAHVRAEAVDGHSGPTSVHAVDCALDLDHAGGLAGSHVESLDVTVTLPPPGAEAPASSTDAAPEPPPRPLAPRGKRHGHAPSEPFHPPLPLPDLHAWRSRLRYLADRAAPRFPDGAKVAVDGLTMEVVRGREKLAVGPGPASVSRHDAELALDYSTRGAADATPLALHARLPLGQGDAVLELSGGPVSLSIIGVKEGALGLTDVERSKVGGRARVDLDDAGDALTFDVDLKTQSLSLRHPKLADEPVRDMDLRLFARGLLDDKGALRLDDAEVGLGSLHLHGHGGLEETSDHLAATLGFDVPIAGCQSLLESVPAALVPHLAQARFRGTFAAKGYLAFDTRKIDDMSLSYDVDDECKMAVVPDALRKDRFQQTFTQAIIDKDGKEDEREAGPGSDDWVDLSDISPFAQVAVLTTEDGAFFHHHGFNHAAIRSALIADIKAGRFVRGASTITMQLAKNLFLSREKTLSRKLEEVILADYLENTFSKEEMMELYLNVIEFGPDLYGIGPAAMHYFGRRPAELDLAESLFLSSLLPNPIGYHKIYERGELPPSWDRNLHALMEIAERSGKISQAELDEGQKETIVFHKEGTPLPPARPPVTGAHLLGDDDWETTDAL